MGAAGKLKRRRDHGEGDEATAASPGAAGSSPVGSKVVAKAAAENDSAAEPASASAADTAERAAKRPRVEENRTLFVRSLPASVTDESLVAFFSEHFPVKHATIVKDRATKASRGYGFVTFTDAEDAIEAKRKLHNQKFDGSKINLEVAETRKRKPAAESAADAISQKEQRRAALEEAKKPQNSKLIIRNLPWSIKTSEQLAALFQHHGKIKFADLPQNKGKLSGFGFVTFRRRRHAELALEADNAKVVDGRTIVVDWAADKKEWTKQQKPEASEKADKADDKADGDESEEQEEDKEDEADEEEDEDMRNFMKNHMENLEDEDGEDNDEEDDGEGEEDDEDDEDDDNNSKTPSKPLMTSNDTTLFIRNLPYSVTDEELKAHFEQFGRIRYARVVVDRATDRPAGVGFVCFVSGEESKACLRNAPRPRQSETTGKRSVLQDEMADAAGMYTLEGRVLQVSQAVNKDEATRLAATGAAAREGKNQDKRRLYLLSEGTISNGSPLHSLLSEAEIKMRDESLAQRKKMIQTNPSLHLSLTRLAIRNIPRNVDSKELKVLAREAVVGFAKDVKEGRREPLSREEITRGGAEDREAERQRREKGKGVVKQTKIVFENKQGSKVAEVDGAGKSRGYGFIEYHSHRAALMGLRWLNGHAVKSDTGKTHRLIVEFAIENAQVVARRQDLQTKFHHKGSEQAAKPTTGRAPFASRDDKAPFKKGKPPGPKGDAKGDAKGARGAKGAKADEKNDGDESKSATRKALDQKIIGRKRTMRKKKATARRG